MVSPQLIEDLEAPSWLTNTDPKATPEFAVKKGDVITAWVAVESANGTPTFSISGGSLTWTARATENGGTTNRAAGFLWTAAVDADKSMTVTFDRTAGASTQRWGWGLKVWRGSEGVGKAGSTNNGTGSGAPLLNLTTETDNAAVEVLVADWNATEGARTWRKSAGTATETVQYADGAVYAVHGAHHADAGAKGAKELGLTAPSTQRYVILAVEVKGSTGDVTISVPSAGATASASAPVSSVGLGPPVAGAGASGLAPAVAVSVSSPAASASASAGLPVPGVAIEAPAGDVAAGAPAPAPAVEVSLPAAEVACGAVPPMPEQVIAAPAAPAIAAALAPTVVIEEAPALETPAFKLPTRAELAVTSAQLSLPDPSVTVSVAGTSATAIVDSRRVSSAIVGSATVAAVTPAESDLQILDHRSEVTING